VKDYRTNEAASDLASIGEVNHEVTKSTKRFFGIRAPLRDHRRFVVEFLADRSFRAV
jgi:hypothetical protein